MSRYPRIVILLTVIGLASPAPADPQPVPAAAPEAAATAGPRATAEAAVNDVLAVLRNPDLTPAKKSHAVADIVADRIDFHTLARLSLGQSWKELSDNQRTEFVTEFRKHVQAVCRAGTDQYGGQDLIVHADRPEAGGDHTVLTRVVGTKNGLPRDVAKIDFRMRQKDDRWKVIDVTISGVSMAVSFRAQFSAIMKDGGIDKLLKLLREKNAAAEATVNAAENR